MAIDARDTTNNRELRVPLDARFWSCVVAIGLKLCEWGFTRDGGWLICKGASRMSLAIMRANGIEDDGK